MSTLSHTVTYTLDAVARNLTGADALTVAFADTRVAHDPCDGNSRAKAFATLANMMAKTDQGRAFLASVAKADKSKALAFLLSLPTAWAHADRLEGHVTTIASGKAVKCVPSPFVCAMRALDAHAKATAETVKVVKTDTLATVQAIAAPEVAKVAKVAKATIAKVAKVKGTK